MRPERCDGTATVSCHINYMYISKYVPPSTLTNLSKRGNDDKKPGDPEAETRRMHSSTDKKF